MKYTVLMRCPSASKQVHRGVEPVLAPVRRDIREPLPVVVAQLLPLQAHGHDAFRPRKRAHCFPGAIWVQCRLPERRAGGGVAQVIIELAVGGGGWRQHGREARAAGDIGVHIGGHVLPRRPRRSDHRHRRVHLAPVRLASGFEVVDLHRHVCAPADFQCLRQPFEKLICLRAQMRHQGHQW